MHSWVGWGGDVDVRENLRHIRMLRNFLGWVGWGGGCWRSWELATHAHATSLLGLGGVGDVDVLENLRHTRAASEFGNGVGWTPKKIFWRKRVACWTSACAAEREKIRASFQHKNPCNLQAMMLKPLDFPRENSRIFEMKVNSFAMAKTTFFQKRSKRWRGFPPDGMFLMMILQQSVFNVPHPVNTRSLVVSQNRQQTNLRSWVKKKTKGKRCVSKIFSTYWKEHTSNPNHPPFFLFEYSILLFCGWWCKWDTPLKIKHRTWKWWFGRWFSSSRGVFSGSMLIF